MSRFTKDLQNPDRFPTCGAYASGMVLVGSSYEENNVKRNLNLSRLMVLLAVLAMAAFAVSIVSAADDTTSLPTINDGRVNEFDIAAPVAIYDTYSYPYADDVNMGVLDHIEFWGIPSGGDTIQKVMNVTHAEIVAAEPSAGSSVLVASNDGYSLYHEVDGSLTLVGPFNYTFNWTPSL